MGESVAGVEEALTRLRRAHRETLFPLSQADVIGHLMELAERWRDPAYALRRRAEQWQDPFPFAMVKVSLDSLLESLRPDVLWRLIDAEGVRDGSGHAVVGHVIAGNTPLLAWVSVIRALLVRSASLVKLPSGPAAGWGRLFAESLADVSPDLAGCVRLTQWTGGTHDLDGALCRGADIVMAHGSDETLNALRSLCPPHTPFVGYGHRVSFAVVPEGQGTAEAALGLARDVLLCDQGGCLSPQAIFVEGSQDQNVAFGERLAQALTQVASTYPLPVRATRAAMTVREARLLARMGEGNRLWEDPGLRWTVIARPRTEFSPSPTFGVVSVQPLPTLADLPEALALIAARLQGCAVAGEAQDYLPYVSYLCAPGQLQAPPLSWRQDGRDVLRVLLTDAYRADGRTTTRVSAGSSSAEISSVGLIDRTI